MGMTDREARFEDSDRISKVLADERADLDAALKKCKTFGQRDTIFYGNFHRVVGQRERLWADLCRLHAWATNYQHSDPEVVRMLEEIGEALGER